MQTLTFSEIAYTVEQVWVAGIIGTIEMSPTLKPVTPYTVKLGDTTPARERGAIAAVPDECAVLGEVFSTNQFAICASVAMSVPGDCSTGVKCCMLFVANHLRINLMTATKMSLSTGFMFVWKSMMGSA